jgi:predicted Ser/Thr protein kinase
VTHSIYFLCFSEAQTLSFSRSESSVKRSQIPYNDLSIEKELGDGSFGKVYLGRWNGAPVALKFCRKKESLEDVMSEIKIMVYVYHFDDSFL